MSIIRKYLRGGQHSVRGARVSASELRERLAQERRGADLIENGTREDWALRS